MVGRRNTSFLLTAYPLVALSRATDTNSYAGYVTSSPFPDLATAYKPTATFSISTPSAWSVFKTEPTFRPEFFDITQITNDLSLLAPGYLFIDPTFKPQYNGLGPWGPQIYDQVGNLVWHGDAKIRTQNFHVCDYLGQRGAHLCIHERLNRKKWPDASRIYRVPSGVKYVLDETYAIVGQNFTTGISGFGTNGHEFNEQDVGESFIHPVAVLKSMDLSPYGGDHIGWVLDACFQEVDFRSGDPIFEWCWLDHLPIWQTNLFPKFSNSKFGVATAKAGRGTLSSPWDFAHINSIDKTCEGDYLFSVRHCDQIVKIAGLKNIHGVNDGTVLWQLGGKANNFAMKFSFSKQHDVRVLSTNRSETVISLLNNDLAGNIRGLNDVSAGQIIRVNNETLQASLIQDYPQPNGLLTGGKGNLQVLNNKNVLIGWGFLPAITEYDYNGRVLFHAKFTAGLVQEPSFTGLSRFENSYRAFKSPWIGRPHWKPKLLAYSRTCSRSRSSPLMAYVSWNGATEVKHWRFSTATESDGPWFLVGIFPKVGFETRADLSNALSERFSSFARFVLAEAIDTHGAILGNVSAEVFVPMSKISRRCDYQGCKPDIFDYDPSLSKVEICNQEQVPAFLPLILFVILVESLSYIATLGGLATAQSPKTVALDLVNIDEPFIDLESLSDKFGSA